jgi:hypothetical protein
MPALPNGGGHRIFYSTGEGDEKRFGYFSSQLEAESCLGSRHISNIDSKTAVAVMPAEDGTQEEITFSSQASDIVVGADPEVRLGGNENFTEEGFVNWTSGRVEDLGTLNPNYELPFSFVRQHRVLTEANQSESYL